MTEANETPAESLARVDRVQAAIAGGADRFPRFLAVYGVGVVAVTTWSGFITENLFSAIGFIVAWPVFVTAICLWMARQRAALRGMGGRWALYLSTQMVIFFAALTFGLTRGLEGQVAYWLPMGVLAALPIFAAAAYEGRLLRRARGAA